MKKEKWQQLAHLLAGLLTLAHGFDGLEKGDLMTAATYLGCGILFLLIAGLHKSLLRKFMQGDTAVFFLEGIILVYTAWQYKTNDVLVWRYFLGAIGLTYVAFGLLSIRHTRTNRHRSGRKRKRKHKISGEEFIQAVRRTV